MKELYVEEFIMKDIFKKYKNSLKILNREHAKALTQESSSRKLSLCRSLSFASLISGETKLNFEIFSKLVLNKNRKSENVAYIIRRG